jgi:ankyrin repeat protein
MTDSPTARLLLARGATVDGANPATGGTAFHCACRNNQPGCAEALIRAGCDVGLKHSDGNFAGMTGREVAEVKGHVAVVERLRAVVAEQLRVAGPAPAATPAAVAGDGGPADQLLLAAAEGDGAAVSRRRAAGGAPNASVPGQMTSSRDTAASSPGEVVHSTALCEAAGHGRLEAVRLLLDAGADPSLASDGYTPLMLAAWRGQLEVLRLLLRRGTAVNTTDSATGTTAFHIACMNNQAECAEALVRAGCDVGLKDNIGETGREVAEGRGHAAVVARLRAVVAEQLRAAQAAGPAPVPTPAAVANDGGLVDHLAQAAAEGDGAVVSRLLAAGADPNASVPGRMASGEFFYSTALCEAAGHGWLEAVRLLLDAGADPSLATSDGITPLLRAARKGQLEVLRLLVARAAALDAADPATGYTAFHHACRQNQAVCAEELARAGCDDGLKSTIGETGQEVAEARGHAAVLQRLGSINFVNQLRVARAAGRAPVLVTEPAPADAARGGDEWPAASGTTWAGSAAATAPSVPVVHPGQALTLAIAEDTDGAAVARLLAAGADPNTSA